MTIEQKAWDRVEEFLSATSFKGFTSDDLFIKRFIPKGWGQDIAALSNMAEAIQLRNKAKLWHRDQSSSCHQWVVVGL